MGPTHSPRTVTFKALINVYLKKLNIKINQIKHLMLEILQDAIKATWEKKIMRQISVAGSILETNQ